jgi:hypothetical protein
LLPGIPSLSCIIAVLTMGRPYSHAESSQVIQLNPSKAEVGRDEEMDSMSGESVGRILLRKLFNRVKAESKHVLEHPIARYIEMIENRNASLTNGGFVSDALFP